MPSSEDPAGLLNGPGPRADARVGRKQHRRAEAGAGSASGDASEALQGRGRGGAAVTESPAQQLLLRYARRRSVALRNQIIELHREVVESMARSLALRLPPSVDPMDLVHAGMWGLMQAIDKYDAARCNTFLAFMRIRVRGAMLDELRHMDFLPRLYRRRIRERDQAIARLRGELRREPNESEVAEALGVTVAQLQRSYGDRAQVQSAGRVDVSGDGAEDGAFDSMDRLADDDVESPIESLSRQELLDKIQQSLEPIEWRVLQLHYFEGMNGKEVARRLRLSASRICQIHCRVLDRLKQRLQPAV